MAEKDQHNRYRCLEAGCNPVMKASSPEGAKELGDAHTEATGHRTAKWPIRTSEGKRKARVRNKTGYYDKYNGAKPRPEFIGSSTRDCGEAIYVGGEFYGYDDYDDEGYAFGEDDF